MMEFIREIFQVLSIEVLGVAVTAFVLYVYWKGMTHKHHNQ